MENKLKILEEEIKKMKGDQGKDFDLFDAEMRQFENEMKTWRKVVTKAVKNEP